MNEFSKTITAVAKALGGMVIKAPDSENGNYAEISFDLFPVTLYHDTYRKKLSISIKRPTWRNAEGNSEQVSFDYVTSNVERNEGTDTTNIHCSPDKAPKKIAADIRNRLGKHGKDIYDRAVKNANEAETSANAKRVTLEKLAAHFGEIPRKHSPDSIYVGGQILTVSSANSVRIDHIDCSPETAKAIMALLMDDAKRKEE